MLHSSAVGVPAGVVMRPMDDVSKVGGGTNKTPDRDRDRLGGIFKMGPDINIIRILLREVDASIKAKVQGGA